MLELMELREVVPKQHRSKITQEFVDNINQMTSDPAFGERYADNILTYSKVLQEGRFKLNDYFNATKFVTHMMLGCTSLEAFKRTFPDKVKDWLDKNVSTKDIGAYASTYKNSKLVTLIYEQTLIPDHIMYASARHKAIRRQVELLDSQSEHVAQKAADSLMNHLKAPEKSNITLDLATKDTGIISDLSKALANLSIQQAKVIGEGTYSTKDIAHSSIMEVNND